MKTPGQRIKEERTALGWSQQRLADEISKIKKERITRAAVAFWETGDSKTQKPENLFAVAEAMNILPKWLLDGTGEKFAISKKGAEETPLVPPGDSRLPIQSGPGKELLELLSSGALREAEVSVLTTTAKLFASGRARKNRQLHESAEFLPPVGDTTGVSKKLIRELTEKK